MESPGPVKEYLRAELAANRIVELSSEIKHRVIVNRFGVIEKKGNQGNGG